jgi:dihydropteroate synthase
VTLDCEASAEPRQTGRVNALMARLAGTRRCLVSGVVNVTPDSFSDGGLWWEPADAIAHGLEMLALGADILDVGGESTRPGAVRPPVEEELRRVLPVVAELAGAGAVVSIDTMRAQVAEAALDLGAGIVNDVSGGLADPRMLPLVVERGCPYIAMHWRGHAVDMQDHASYDDVVADVVRELSDRVHAILGAGVDPSALVLDPGLGFAKTSEQNWTLLDRLDAFVGLGYPVLLGASRKAFLGKLLADPVTAEPRPARRRDAATAAVSAIAAVAGVWCVRAHDVGPSLDAVRVAGRLVAERRR